jgi:Ca-activated chloride channel family protein
VICLAFVIGCSVRSREQAPSVTEEAKQDKAVDESGGTGTAHKGTEGMMGDPGRAMPAPSAPIAFDSDSKSAKAVAAKKLLEAGSYGAVGALTPVMGSYGGGGGAFVAPTEKPAAPIPILDPNARYATTYRPGGAALSAFDAALARGTLPVASKDLVGDFGARYAPAIDAPKTGAMAFAIDLERGAVGPSGGPMHLRIALKGSEVAPLRAPLSVHVVLDVSGSMAGASIDHARKAAEALVQKLEPTDHFSLTTFSNDAKTIVGSGSIGPRRESVIKVIREIGTEGGTNVSSGLDLGYAQAQKDALDGAVKIVMLLSDGHANGGDTDPKSLARRSSHAFQEGVQTSTFGIGTDFDGALLASIADQGAGAYYYLAEPSQIAPALTKELDARLVPVSQALEVRVRLRAGVNATKVYGSSALDEETAALIRAQEVAVDGQVKKKDGIAEDRKDDAKGGMRFFIPAFAKGDRHAMLLSLNIPATASDKPIASVEIKYKDRLLKKNVTQEIPVRLAWAKSDAESAATINPSVQATVQAFAAGDAILKAAELVEKGNRVGARTMLTERATLLRKAKDVTGDVKLAEDAARLDKLGDAVSGPSQVSDPLVLAVLLRGSSSGYLR